MGNLIDHAKRELKAIGYNLDQVEEDPDKWIVESVLELIEVFSKQGHSGSSAPFLISYFEKLAKFEPLCPLTGEDDEWNEVSDGLFQNNRASSVFWKDGQAYDSQGKIFREPSGACYQNGDSHVDVTFPYTPKTEYVDVPAEGE